MSARRLYAALAVAPCLGAPAHALAQASEPAAVLERVQIEGSAGRRQLPLDEPAASGSRLALTPRETPASIDVIDEETMAERGASTSERALQSAVGVASGQCFGLTCFSMRGFSGVLSVPFAIDGVRYPGLAMSPRGTFNYERIEVIKGPSSVLHGLGAVTGLVNWVTRGADGRDRRDVLLAYDRWNTRTVGVGAGGKAGETVAWRADVSNLSADKGSAGFVDRSDYDYTHASGEIAWTPTARLRVSLAAQYLVDDGRWYFGTPLVAGRIDERVRFNNYNVDDGTVRKEVGWMRARIAYGFSPGLRLTNETYANDENRFWRNTERYTYNAGTGQVDRGDFLWITHDQRLVGNRTELAADDRLWGVRNRAAVGVDVSRNRHQRDNNSPFAAPPSSVDFFDPVPGQFATISPFLPVRRTVLDQRAVYVEDLLDLSAATKASASLRRDWLALESIDLRGTGSFERSWRGDSWRLGLLHDLLPKVTLYAQVGRALEPAAQIVTLTLAQRNFELTRARQAEAGVKASLPGGRGEATLAVYEIARTNVLTRDPVNPALTVQIGEQSSRGVEADVVLRPSAAWTVQVNGTVLDARFDRFVESVGGTPVSRAGNVPPDVPERLASAWFTWQFAPPWRAGAGVRYVGRRAANNANTVWMDAYTVGDLWLAYKLPLGEATLRVRNATDAVYATRSYGASQVILGEPRSVEVSWRARF
ncbi:MAG: TonB-dependent receptor [Burkholderiaceae bacterium]